MMNFFFLIQCLLYISGTTIVTYKIAHNWRVQLHCSKSLEVRAVFVPSHFSYSPAKSVRVLDNTRYSCIQLSVIPN